MQKTLETDYLIVGCGAVGMAFADIILTETDDTILMVDQFHKPGGHWNLAYPFVRLHQPASFYGVSSTKLGDGSIDQVGFNKGLSNLASGASINAYYDDLMQNKLLSSGRVKFFPLCNYQGEGKFTSTLTGEKHEVKVNKKIVDATHIKTKVPANHQPNFTLDSDVNFIPINSLPNLKETPQGFVVIGGGKTGIDACLWLLENNVNPDNITWIVSRDGWLIDRKNLQPTNEGLKDFLNYRASQFEALAQAESIPDLFTKLENAGVLIRIDQSIQPKMFRGATISQIELEQLRRVKNVVREGRIKHLGKDKITFENSTIEMKPGPVYVDCSANALSHAKTKPVFSGNTITPQTIRGGQIVFSAALIAHIEASYSDEELKNELCKVIELPSQDTDWLKMLLGSIMNQQRWREDEELSKWINFNRLDGFTLLTANVSPDDLEVQAILNRIRKNIKPGIKKLHQFVSELD